MGHRPRSAAPRSSTSASVELTPTQAGEAAVGQPGPLEPEAETWPTAAQQPISRFASDVLGFELWPRQQAILDAIYALDVRTAVLRLGRRSGKGRMAALVALYESTANADAHLAHVQPGEQVAVAIVATSQQQARVVHRYVASWLRGSALSSLITRDTDDTIELSNGVVILTMPATSRSTRGYAIAVLVMDEAAWMQGTDGSPLAAKEIHDALAPGVAQFPQGRILVTSTPRWSTGWFADLCRAAASGEYPDMAHWHGTTEQLNPTISTAFLAREEARDPAMYAREYLAQWSAGVGAVFPDHLVRAAVSDEPVLSSPAYQSVISLDPSSGTGRDAFAMVVGHRDHQGGVEVQDVRGWRGGASAPVSHAAILDEVAATAKSMEAPVLLDQWASEPIAQGLEARGCRVIRRAWTNESKAEAVAVLRQLLHASKLSIPRHAALVGELVSYEQRLLPSGKARYSAPPGAHDDHATALLALCHHLKAGADPWAGPLPPSLIV